MYRLTGSLPDRRPLSLFAILAVFLLAVVLFFSGCSKIGGAKENAPAADSTVAAPDSAAGAKKSGGFLARFRKGDEDEKKEELRVPVELALVGREDVASTLGATASLEAEKLVDVQCKAAGQIKALPAEEGDWVERGELLALLDGEAETVALEEASLRAEAGERDFARGEALHAEQGISNKELQDLRFRWEEADAQRKAAALRLEYTRILAPFSGRITERLVAPGQHVAPGTPLFRLVDSDPLLACVYLPEKLAARIAIGQAVRIVPDSAPELELPGEVLRIAPIVDTRTGTVKVTCRVSAGDELLRPGSFVRVQVETDLHANVLVIPKRALVPEGGETYVFKAVADSVIKVSITTGYADAGRVEVLTGLAEGDRVVSVGTGSLKSGSKIEDLVSKAGAAADSAQARDKTS